MPSKSKKKTQKSEIFDSASSREPVLKLSRPEALMVLSVLAVAADGKMVEEEKQTLAANHVRLFSFYSSEEFQELFKKVMGLLNEYSSSDLFTAAKAGLTPQLRETAFAIATDLIMSDGVVTQEEKDFMSELWEALEIEDGVAEKIIEVMMIKNCGENLNEAEKD